jgi:nicotinamidase-related amidase
MPEIEGLGLETTQVLLCHLQSQIVARSKTTDPESLRKSAGVLAELAHLFSLPMIFSIVPQQEKEPELIPELERQASGVPQFVRASVSPFLDPATCDALASSGRKTLIIAGVNTEVVVLHAVVDAIRRGYKVLVPVDACGGMSERTEQAAFRQIESAGAVTTSVVSIATALAPDSNTDLGKRMFAIVQQLRLD